jgi:hypothetical protein
MGTARLPKRRVELVLHGAKSMQTSLIDTAVEARQRTMVFQHCTEVIQLWKSIKHLKNPEDGNSTFSETSGRASATRY